MMEEREGKVQNNVSEEMMNSTDSFFMKKKIKDQRSQNNIIYCR